LYGTRPRAASKARFLQLRFRQALAFGEMVALLWAEKNYQAAVCLEQLWDDLVCTHSFSLLCAYPIQGFNCEEQIPLFQQVCRAHSRVFLSDGKGDAIRVGLSDHPERG
jgi:hypothetical protein